MKLKRTFISQQEPELNFVNKFLPTFAIIKNWKRLLGVQSTFL